MGVLKEIYDKAQQSANGTSSGTTLQDFLCNFSSTDGKWINQLDPYTFFDVTMKFYPTIYDNNSSNVQSQIKKYLESFRASFEQSYYNYINNITDGYNSQTYSLNQVNIQSKHDSNPNAGKSTFLETIAGANLLVGGNNWNNSTAGQAISPLELQLGIYCQDITIPDFEIPASSNSQTVIGEFPIIGTYVKTNSNILNMNILNTKVPLFERVFYPWMREVTMPWWSYHSQPYTTATIIVDMTKHSDIKYIFCGCKPQMMKSMQANQQADTQNKVRQIGFMFDYMFITSSFTNCDSFRDKLINDGQTFYNRQAQQYGM